MNSDSELSSSVIRGVGSYLPEKNVDNIELSKRVDTSDEWITSRTGIKARRIAEKEPSSDGKVSLFIIDTPENSFNLLCDIFNLQYRFLDLG